MNISEKIIGAVFVEGLDSGKAEDMLTAIQIAQHYVACRCGEILNYRKVVWLEKMPEKMPIKGCYSCPLCWSGAQEKIEKFLKKKSIEYRVIEGGKLPWPKN